MVDNVVDPIVLYTDAGYVQPNAYVTKDGEKYCGAPGTNRVRLLVDDVPSENVVFCNPFYVVGPFMAARIRFVPRGSTTTST